MKQLEEALARRLDIDETLWFLALDNALMNCDGYWVPTGDFDLYLDEEGRFHLIPRDANEAFREPGGMIAGGVQVSGAGLDPLFGIDDPGSRSSAGSSRYQISGLDMWRTCGRSSRSGSISGSSGRSSRSSGPHRERRLGRPAEAG